MPNIILFGPPGSGKGTQAAKLVDKFGLLHISTGDLFRYELGNNTPLGKEARSYMEKGELVPDRITIAMLRNKVEKNLEVKGFIFDGFPRTIPQAEALDQLMDDLESNIDGLIALDVNDQEIINRIKMRGETSGRADDLDEEIIKNRIQVYKSETAPVYNYYDEKNKAYKVDGMGTIDEIFSRLAKAVERL
jgi:adenylate kinase